MLLVKWVFQSNLQLKNKMIIGYHLRCHMLLVKHGKSLATQIRCRWLKNNKLRFFFYREYTLRKKTESSIWGHMHFFEKIKTFFFARANVTSRKSPAQEMATLESIFFTWKIIFKKYIYIRRFQGTFQTSFVNDSFTSSNLKTLEQHIKTIALNFIPFCRWPFSSEMRFKKSA